MNRFKLALRLSLCIGCLTILLVVCGQLAGVIPDAARAHRSRRKTICESLAVHCALAAGRHDIQAIERIASMVAERSPDIVQLTVSRGGETLLEHGAQLPKEPPPGMIAAEVPVLAGSSRWGAVRVVFGPAIGAEGSWLGRLRQDPAMRLTLYFATVGQAVVFAYCFWLSGSFTSSAPLPDRVRDTLDSFAEGILVLNPEQKVAFANRAFCATAGRQAGQVEGQVAGELGWSAGDPLPWEQLGKETTARGTVVLRDADLLERSLSVRAIAIADDSGQIHGSLATFDDLTTVEEMNRRLKRLLETLRESQARVQEQNRELERLATRDPLTDCLNRRAFYDQFRPLFESARRHRHAIGCVMVDIDHFKSINDQHGHAMGDEVLRQVAATLREAGRSEDLVCRFGGEEFCIILPHTGSAGTRETAERCRQRVAALKFDALSVTASFGISELSLGAPTEEQLLEQADQALYVAKRGGRNRVVAFDDTELANAGV